MILTKRPATILACFLLVLEFAFAETKISTAAPSGRFEVVQEYQSEHTPTIRFRDQSLPAVRLPAFPWPGIFSISPDERWILRTQKTGSGESFAILYRVEESGRVPEVVGFDDILWNASDKVARLKRKALYHTGIEDSAWTDDGRSLEIILRGSDSSKNGAKVRTRVVYELGKGVAPGKEMPLPPTN
jgi:hypothetical protein